MRPEDLRYSKEHEWVRMEEDRRATLGITDFAARELGDIVFIELPETGRKVEPGDALGTIETVKAVEEIYAPVSGTVAEINAALEERPELVNEDPFGEGWLVRLEEVGDSPDLMSAQAYGEMVDEG